MLNEHDLGTCTFRKYFFNFLNLLFYYTPISLYFSSYKENVKKIKSMYYMAKKHTSRFLYLSDGIIQ